MARTMQTSRKEGPGTKKRMPRGRGAGPRSSSGVWKLAMEEDIQTALADVEMQLRDATETIALKIIAGMEARLDTPFSQLGAKLAPVRAHAHDRITSIPAEQGMISSFNEAVTEELSARVSEHLENWFL